MRQQILRARTYLSDNLKGESPLYEIYLVHILETIVSIGDVQESESTNGVDFELAAEELAQLLPPLALLVTSSNMMQETVSSEEFLSLCRDAWFNLVVHRFVPSSELGKKHYNELKLLATHLRPLIADPSAGRLENDLELNTVLRRGMSPTHTAELKRHLALLLPDCESEVKGLSYSRIMFLRAAHLLETMRAGSGDCAPILAYFVDSTLSSGAMGNCMAAICEVTVTIYIEKSLLGNNPQFSTPNIAKQLAAIFMGCCHRVEAVQRMALSSADRIIKAAPSVLCQRSSLFGLLELLTLMWISCLEVETDEYQWTSFSTSSKGEVSVELSDDYALRKRTLNSLYRRARGWVMLAMNVAPLDIKGLLQVKHHQKLSALPTCCADTCRRILRSTMMVGLFVISRSVDLSHWKWVPLYPRLTRS